jgi:NHLM bacteriocin system ABC transporter ATP-binding protein
MVNSATKSRLSEPKIALTAVNTVNGKPVPVDQEHVFVEDGAVDVFLERTGQAGSRHFLFKALSGETVFGCLDLRDGVRLIAYPKSPETRLGSLDPARFDELLEQGNPTAIARAEAWMRRCERDLAISEKFEFEDCSTPAFSLYRRQVGSDLSMRMERLAAQQAEIIAGKDARDRAALQNTLGGAVAQNKQGATSDPLVSVFERIASASNITLPDDLSDTFPENPTADPAGRLAAIARRAKVRIRRIQLSAGWWLQGGQSLLAFRRDGTPVALIARTGWRSGYDLWGPDCSSPRAVDEAQARQLAPFAYAFQRGMPHEPLDGRRVARFVGAIAWPFLPPILLTGVIAGALGIVAPIATQMLFDSVIPASARNELLQLVIGLAALGLGGIAFELVRGFLLLRMTTLLNADLEGALWDRLLRLPASFFRLYPTGDLLIRAGAVNQMRELLSGAVLNTLLSAIFSVFTFAVLIYYEWRLAFVASAVVLVQLTGITFVNLRILAWRRRSLAVESRQQSLSLQLLQGISKIKIAGAEARGFARWAKVFMERRDLDLRQSQLSVGLGAFTATMNVLSSAILIWMVGFGGVTISIGEYAAFSAAYGQFIGAMLGLAGVLPTIMAVLPLYERAKPLLSAVPESSGSRSLPGDLKGDVEINNVVFRYSPDGPTVLDNVSIRAQAGEFIAIVGSSGSGKSTLVRLLLGFDMPEAGAIFLDHQDLKGLDLEAVRRQMGVVLQAAQPSTGTVLENILGHAALSEQDAWEAARLAGIDQDIALMPMRMQTFIGENGSLLSGGQRQRLMIARAVLRRPRVLVFDEATSALDNRTQEIVADSLSAIKSTRIVIAHRLTTIQKADRIYVLKDGKVVETGKFQDLLCANGVFSSLVRQQIT